jgi:5'-deoxynucleotidase YfbR-like HD superfamily hydrolase
MTDKANQDTREGNWTQLSHGLSYDFDAGKIAGGTLDVAHLARAMSGANRYNSWTDVWWSTAAHAVLVAEILAAVPDHPPVVVLKGLHHDDHEVITGDPMSPFRTSWSLAMRKEYQYHADRAQTAIERHLGIHKWFGVLIQHAPTADAIVKMADIAALEAERLKFFSVRMHWQTESIVSMPMLETARRLLDGDFGKITGGPEAAARFVARHNTLIDRMAVVA